MRERVARGTTLGQLIDEMDEAGVAKAVLCSGYGGADNIDWVRKAVATHPDRFANSAVVDPRQGMAAVRFVEDLVRNENCRLVRMLALETEIPYNDAATTPSTRSAPSWEYRSGSTSVSRARRCLLVTSIR